MYLFYCEYVCCVVYITCIYCILQSAYNTKAHIYHTYIFIYLLLGIYIIEDACYIEYIWNMCWFLYIIYVLIFIIVGWQGCIASVVYNISIACYYKANIQHEYILICFRHEQLTTPQPECARACALALTYGICSPGGCPLGCIYIYARCGGARTGAYGVPSTCSSVEGVLSWVHV